MRRRKLLGLHFSFTALFRTPNIEYRCSKCACAYSYAWALKTNRSGCGHGWGARTRSIVRQTKRRRSRIKMGVVFSMLWRLDATTACVALFVVALGSLWLYVAFANPSSREYERLEELLSESAVAPSSPAGGGTREGKKGRGKGKTVSSCTLCLRCAHTRWGAFADVVLLPLVCGDYN